MDGALDEFSRVVAVAWAIGERLGLSTRELRDVIAAAQVYDVGKSEIPSAVLHKPGALDDAELEIMRGYPIIGARVLAAVDSLARLAPIVRAVHERWDGMGYPDGLIGDQIPRAARIVAVAAAYHAMTAERSYRDALDHDVAVAELQRNAGSQFCPVTVNAAAIVLTAA
jgi:HD-GYP domain-containing protein (c-di-GMP phosphodiesterase class II)